MSSEEWLKYVKRMREDPDWDRTHGGRGALFFGMFTAIRIHLGDRPWKWQ